MTYFLATVINPDASVTSYWVEASTHSEAEQRFDYVFPEAGPTSVHRASVQQLPADTTYVCMGVHKA